MSIENRPFVGSWTLNNKSIVRHTPDAIVYFNGDTSLPGCATCNGKIDLQRFITQVSVDPATAPPASASISLHIPRQYGQSVQRDAQWILRPGLEVNIYMRGYFPVQGALGAGSSEENPDLDLSNVVLYPYYHVFHGVITEVSSDYSGSDHTYSLSCADLLHFWSYQRMSTSASFFGARPSNSKNRVNLIGNNFNGMTPFSIIYSLWRDVAGAAGGVQFFGSEESNVTAKSSSFDRSLFSMTMLYWEKRFSERMFNLRMYGVNGTLYNAFQQAFLSKLSTSEAQSLTEIRFADKTVQDKKQSDPFLRLSRLVNYDPVTQWVASEAEPGGDGSQSLGLSLTQMQAFVQDLGDLGAVNFYESQYETKLDMVNAVTGITGFEFYQDVDGDVVFKPPFYNLDTSSSRAYVIKPIDIISFSSSEGEPEATVIKATSTYGRNMTGIVSGAFGAKRGQYIDYRLVAQYGWREQAFETEYYSDPRAMFFASINRLDLFNIAVNSASCQIPLRPELRPGYPVYIEHLDCYYYLSSFNHSFSYGGQCTTTLNLVGKRAKFLAPGVPPLNRSTSVDDIKLDNPWLPKLPLQVNGYNGVPRIQGFPNVVMALDPELMNPLFFITGSINTLSSDGNPDTQLDQLILLARMGGNPVITLEGSESVIEDEKEKILKGPFVILTGNGQSNTITRDALRGQLTTLSSAQNQLANLEASLSQGREVSPEALSNAEATLAEAETVAADINVLIKAAQDSLGDNFPEASSTAAYLDLLDDTKSAFSPNVPGYYRYYSASHPDPEQQGQKSVIASELEGTIAGTLTPLEDPTTVLGFRVGGTGVELTDIPVTAGISIMQPGTKEALPTPTHLIQQISFARHELQTTQTSLGRSSETQLNFTPSTYEEAMKVGFNNVVLRRRFTASDTIQDLFQEQYEIYENAIIEIMDTVTYGVVVPSFEAAVNSRNALVTDPIARSNEDPNSKALLWSKYFARKLARAASQAAYAWVGDLRDTYGDQGQAPALGTTAEAKQETLCALSAAWNLLQSRLDPEGKVSLKTSAGRAVKRTRQVSRTKEFYSPVFPVSDERGYEVLGTYRYGRGLKIEAGGNFDQVTDGDELAEDLGIETVEEVIDSLLSSSDLSKALGTLDPETQAELATALDIDTSNQTLSDVVQSNEGATLFENQFRARAANINQFTQKTTVLNTAYGLSDLEIETVNNVCSCKGAEADVLLLAFDPNNFIDLGLSDEASNFVASNMANDALSWKASQDAIRGKALETNPTSLVSTIQQASQDLSNILPQRELSQTATEFGEFQTASEAVSAAAEQLAVDIANFNSGNNNG